MVSNVVLDNSVLIALVASDEDSSYSERVLQSTLTGTRLLAPALCLFEFGNALVTCVRRKRMTLGDVWTAFERLQELPIEFRRDSSFHELSAIHALADQTGLSFYDATYLMLATIRLAPLATLDKNLRTAAMRRGVEIFE